MTPEFTGPVAKETKGAQGRAQGSVPAAAITRRLVFQGWQPHIRGSHTVPRAHLLPGDKGPHSREAWGPWQHRKTSPSSGRSLLG